MFTINEEWNWTCQILIEGKMQQTNYFNVKTQLTSYPTLFPAEEMIDFPNDSSSPSSDLM